MRDFPPAGSLSINQMRIRDGSISPELLRSAAFSLMVVFRGFTLDPNEITTMLCIEPTLHWRKGDPWRARDGRLAIAPRHESAWSVDAAHFDRREDDLDVWKESADALGLRLNDRLQEFLAPFVRRQEFVKQLVADAAVACLVIRLPGQFHFGFEIEPATLRAITDLDLQLGVEIFPDNVID